MNTKSMILLSTATCIKCKFIYPKLVELCVEKDIHLQKLDAMKEGMDLVKEFNVSSVPTLLFYENPEASPKVLTGDFTIRDVQNLVED